MAQDHTTQDNRTPLPAQAARQAPSALERGPSALALLGLGACAWVTTVGWVLVQLGGKSPLLRVLAPLAALPLLAGTLVRGRSERAAWTRRTLLVGAYPAALGGVLAVLPEPLALRVHDSTSMSVAMLTLLTYAAAAVLACREPLVIADAAPRPLAPRAPTRTHPQALLRAGFITVAIVGGFAIAIVAPLHAPYTELQAAWGEAAAQGAVLTAVVAGAVGVCVIALFASSALRAADEKPAASPSTQRLRAAALVVLAALGALVHFVVSRTSMLEGF